MFDFNGTNGSTPNGSLTLSGNRLYGMTGGGGASGNGTIFSIDTNGNGFKNLFNFNATNGNLPESTILLLSGKVLYGMTSQGGAHGVGIVFSIDTDGSSFKVLYNFGVGTYPNGSLILSNGILYGMTVQGPANPGNGVIFSIDTNGSNFTDLYNFGGGTLGSEPYGSLLLNGSTFYGMTSVGGANSAGNIFSIDTNGSGYTDLFDFNGTNGEEPFGSLVLSGNTVYGMTPYGGTFGDGNVFSFKTPGLGIDNTTTTQNSVNVYPNPNNGIFTIQSSVDSGQWSVEVYNVLGEQVYSANYLLSTNHYSLDLSSQPNGVYFYRVLKEDGSLIGEGKVILQK